MEVFFLCVRVCVCVRQNTRKYTHMPAPTSTASSLGSYSNVNDLAFWA